MIKQVDFLMLSDNIIVIGGENILKRSFCLLIALIFSANFIGCSSNNGYNQLNNYGWGQTVTPILEKIGVEKIGKISVDNTNTIATVEADGKSIDILLTKNYDNTWDIINIEDHDNYKIVYYFSQRGDHGECVQDITDYKTGEIIEKADVKAKEKYDNEAQQALADVESYAQQQKDDELKQQFIDGEKQISKMVKDYRSNSMKADKDYKDSEFVIAGLVDHVSDSAISFYSENRKVLCMTREGQDEKLLKLNKGDKVVVMGTCNGDNLTSFDFVDCMILS